MARRRVVDEDVLTIDHFSADLSVEPLVEGSEVVKAEDDVNLGISLDERRVEACQLESLV